MTDSATISGMMPVIPKPPSRGPLFGGKSQIVFVGKGMREALARHRERCHRKTDEPRETSPD
jgi:hypothetical protein